VVLLRLLVVVVMVVVMLLLLLWAFPVVASTADLVRLALDSHQV
jgi:hypothetical protein